MTLISDTVWTVERTREFSDWLVELADPIARAAIVARIVRVELGNFGDAKSVGGKVSELRVDVGPGYRVYLTRTGHTVQLLLCGGDKSTQQADIQRAREMVEEIDKANKAAKKKKKRSK
jgi:putative addiction module killer protein